MSSEPIILLAEGGRAVSLSPKEREMIAFLLIEVILDNEHLSSSAEQTEGGFAKTILDFKKIEKTHRFEREVIAYVLQNDISQDMLNSILNRPVLLGRLPGTIVL